MICVLAANGRDILKKIRSLSPLSDALRRVDAIVDEN
jgi:hypothetical protein